VPTQRDISLSWDAVPESDVAKYRIYEEGYYGNHAILLKEVASDQLSTALTGSDVGLGQNDYCVTAVDINGNESYKFANTVTAIGLINRAIGDGAPEYTSRS